MGDGEFQKQVKEKVFCLAEIGSPAPEKCTMVCETKGYASCELFNPMIALSNLAEIHAAAKRDFSLHPTQYLDKHNEIMYSEDWLIEPEKIWAWFVKWFGE